MPASPQYPNELRVAEWQRTASGPKAALLDSREISAHSLKLTNLVTTFSRIDWEDVDGESQKITAYESSLRDYERAAQALATKIRGMRAVGSEVRVWLETSAGKAGTFARQLEQLRRAEQRTAPKPAFRPQHFTSQEWREKISEKCLGEGVEAQLDTWQLVCTPPLHTMDEAELVSASQVATLLLGALDKAEARCVGPSQQGSKTSIGEYRRNVKAFQVLVKAAVNALVDRKKFRTGLTKLDQVWEDKNLLRAFYAHSIPSQLEQTVKAWILFKERKYEQMVRTHGPDNDYNVPDGTNEILLDKFVRQQPLEDKVLNGVLSMCEYCLKQQLEADFLARTFKQQNCQPFNDYLVAKYPIQDFHIA
jgi:hypothetical protein